MTSLSMIGRETRRYMWGRRFDTRNLAVPFGEERNYVPEPLLTLADGEIRKFGLIVLDKDLEYLQQGGIYRWLKTLRYCEKSFSRRCILHKSGMRIVDGILNPYLDEVILKLWQYIARCPNVTEVDGFPLNRPFFFGPMITMPGIKTLIHPSYFYSPLPKIDLRQAFPNLEAIKLTEMWWSDGQSQWSNGRCHEVDYNNKFEVGRLKLVVVPLDMSEDIEGEMAGELIKTYRGLPLLSSCGIDEFEMAISSWSLAIFQLEHDGIGSVHYLMYECFALKPRTITFTLDFEHHMTLGMQQSFLEEGFRPLPIDEPCRQRCGTPAERKLFAREVAQYFPGCDRVNIRMRCTDVEAPSAMFSVGTSAFSPEAEKDLKDRARRYFVEFTAQIERIGDDISLSVEDAEDTELIEIMDEQIHLWEADDFEKYWEKFFEDQ